MVLCHFFLHFVVPDHFKQIGIVKVDIQSKLIILAIFLMPLLHRREKILGHFWWTAVDWGGFGKTLEPCQRKSGGRRRINKSPGTWSAGYNKDPPIKEEICPVIDNISDTASKG